MVCTWLGFFFSVYRWNWENILHFIFVLIYYTKLLKFWKMKYHLSTTSLPGKKAGFSNAKYFSKILSQIFVYINHETVISTIILRIKFLSKRLLGYSNFTIFNNKIISTFTMYYNHNYIYSVILCQPLFIYIGYPYPNSMLCVQVQIEKGKIYRNNNTRYAMRLVSGCGHFNQYNDHGHAYRYIFIYVHIRATIWKL